MNILKKGLIFFLGVTAFVYIISISGCANIIPPGGGPIDSLPPVLVNAVPKDSTTNFKGDKITLTFNEYVEVQDQFQNLIFSPTPNNIPVINAHLRNVTIKLKDTLEPNTTYTINFRNALKDINEGNVYKDFMYVFSTGDSIDENTLTGRVVMAETGKVDTTLIVVLHRNSDDSAVAKEKPRYIAKLDGRGNFLFTHLPAGSFSIYALPNDFSKKYEDTTKPFAFADKPISTTENIPVTLYAYQLKKPDTTSKGSEFTDKESKDKYVRYNTNLEMGRQDLLKNLTITFSRKVDIDTSKIKLADKDLNTISNYNLVRDTSGSAFSIIHNWTPLSMLNLIMDSTAVKDTAGAHLAKNDTIKFATKSLEEYGSLKLRFNNLDFARNPVLQIVQNEVIVESSPLTQRDWYRKLYRPGEYDIRILYDNNKNGKWDPGRFFGTHIQPEIVVNLDTKISVRANWDNEKEITLTGR